MLTEKVVRKPISIGPYALNPGDVLTDEAEALLPAGRLKVLVHRGWFAERPVATPLGLDRLEQMVAELQERVAALESRRGPGRPRKDEV